jgi:recombinational DNA repair protein RecT
MSDSRRRGLTRTHTSLTVFLVTPANNQKAPEIVKLTTLRNIIKRSKLIDPQTGLQNATLVSVLTSCGCTAGRLHAACDVGDIALVRAQRDRTQ